MLLFPDPKPKERAAFLHCLHDITHGSVKQLVYVEEVTNSLHLDEADAEAVLEVLLAEELVRLRLQCIVSITEAGIDEVMAGLNTPAQLPPPAPPPPASAPRTSVSHMLLGAGAFPEDTAELQPQEAAPPVETQQDRDDLELKLICEAIGLDPRELTGLQAPDSNHFGVDASEPQPAPPTRPPIFDQAELAALLASLKLRLLKVRLPKDDLAEAEAEIATALAQLHSPRPKQPIIAASLNTLLSIVEQAGPAALTSDIQVSLITLRSFLQQHPV